MSPEWNATLLRVMLESSLRVCLLAAAVGGILLLGRIRSGSVRHAAWSAVLGAMILMPVLPHWVPAIDVPVPSRARLVEAIPAAIESVWIDPNGEFRDSGAGPPAPAVVASTRDSASTTPPPPRAIWPLALVGIYGAGVLFLLFRLMLGWRAVQAIVRASEPIDRPLSDLGRRTPAIGLLRESALVATPMTVGILAPRILLPSAWKLWPDEKLRAVLAHEFAHVRRRDPLVALLARLNLCLFWFHPVAWWLERKLATTAEHACDDAGLRVMGEKRRYAEVLLDMAEAVRRAGGRVSWDGVGVHGSGLLGQRIDRVLRGELFREVSMTRKIIVALSCAIAVVLVVACRRQQPAPPPLKPNPEFVESRARQKAEGDIYKAADKMTAQQVADLEAVVKKNPEDLAALKKLLIFYAPVKIKIGDSWMPRCAAVVGEKECVAARRAHILWLIEHHPESDLTGSWGARIFATSVDPLPDPVGYEQAKKVWLGHTARPDVSVAILKNAAWFFEVPDKPLTETILIRLQSMDPQGHWSTRLGRLYYLVLVGSNASMPLNVVWTTNPADSRGAYAQQIRKKLEESRDAELLTEAGYSLAQWSGGLYEDHKIDFDPLSLGRSYLERSLQLDPNSVRARRVLENLRESALMRRASGLLRDVPRELHYQKVSALSEAERLELLPFVAVYAWFEGDNAGYYKHDKAAQKAAWDRAAKYAEEMLRLAAKLPNSSNSPRAVYEGHATLGLIAFREGRDTQIAVDHAREASKAAASEDLAYGHPFQLQRLLGYLLKHGERDSVVECLERMAKIQVADSKMLLDAAAQIGQGVMPVWGPDPTLNPY
jgi:beta-lactamase regulating signal transducer with metallopeptidase domain